MMHSDSTRFRWCMGILLVQVWFSVAGCGGGNAASPTLIAAPPPISGSASQVAGMSGAASTQLLGASSSAPIGALDAGLPSLPPTAANSLDAATKPAVHTVPPLVDASMNDQDASSATTDAAIAQADAEVSAHVVHVDSKVVWNASGFQVEAGKCYLVQTKIDGQWLDSDVQANLKGWADQSDPRLALFTPLRRVVQDDIGFYQFATCVDKALDQRFPIGEASTICPKVSGELFFFVDDAPGFETNDVGTATVTIQAQAAM